MFPKKLACASHNKLMIIQFPKLNIVLICSNPSILK